MQTGAPHSSAAPGLGGKDHLAAKRPIFGLPRATAANLNPFVPRERVANVGHEHELTSSFDLEIDYHLVPGTESGPLQVAD